MASFRIREGLRGRTHEVQIRATGQKPITRTFKSLTLAKQWARDTEARLARGEVVGNEAHRHTLTEVIERFLQQRPDLRRDAVHGLNWWKEQHGHLRLSAITRPWLTEERDRLAAGTYKRVKPDKKKATKSTVCIPTANRRLSYLRAALEEAVQWGWLAVNPATGITRLAETRGRTRFLSDAERDQLLKACRDNGTDRTLYPFVACALYSGARAGELLGLRWSNLDLNTGTAVIHTSKTGEGRKLYFSGLALTALQEHAKVRPLQDTGLIFASDPSGRFPYQYGDAFRAACKRAEISNFHFHDLRHSCASYLAQAGLTLQEIGSVLGHRVLQTTLRYAHLVESHTEERMRAALESRLGKYGD